MPKSRPFVVTRQLVGILFGAVVLLAVASAWQLSRSHSDSRDALRDRFADRAPVTTAVVDGLFRAAFTAQGEAAQSTLSGPRVPRAALDALRRRNESTFVLVADARGRVLGATSKAPGGGLGPVERAALRSGYALSDVRRGRVPEIATAVRFRTSSGPRLLVSASPEKVYSEFLNATLKPVAGSADGGAFVVDGRGTAIASVGRDPSIVRRLPAPSSGPTGEFGSRSGNQFYAAAPVGASNWRTVLTTTTSSLYAPSAGLGRWLPWVILTLLVATLMAGVVLVRRLMETGRRLVGANADLEEANENLARSNADLEQFAYVASHDLSSPLRSVTGFSQMLSTRYNGRLDDEADRWIGFIEQGVGRMQRIIDDLLRYSRVDREELRPEQVELDDVLEEVEHMLAPMLEERGAKITSDPLPAVLGEPTHLSQVLQNLIVNATTYVAPGVAPAVHIGAEIRGSMCRLSVTDNGVGIDAEHADRIFKMFQRLHTEEEHPGSGIGLAIAKKIIERHGGRMEVEPAPGGGTTFAFLVPLALRAAPRHAKLVM